MENRADYFISGKIKCEERMEARIKELEKRLAELEKRMPDQQCGCLTADVIKDGALAFDKIK